MKNILNDIIKNVSVIETIEQIKILGSDTVTEIHAVSADKTLVITGVFKTPHPEFIGTFGMPNLGKLKTILSFEEYDDASIIMVNKKTDENGKLVPESISFHTATKDFKNEYRLMSESIIQEKVKNFKLHKPTYQLEFEPAVNGIMRLKKQASANSEEDKFRMITENNELKVYFGDPSTHNGSFVFQSNVDNVLTHGWKWPVKEISNILSLVGDKKMRISNQGACEIVVDTGLAVYTYLIPAQQK
jgi:hypothetical protein